MSHLEPHIPCLPTEKYLHDPNGKIFHVIRDYFSVGKYHTLFCNNYTPKNYVVTEKPPKGFKPCKSCLMNVPDKTKIEMILETIKEN